MKSEKQAGARSDQAFWAMVACGASKRARKPLECFTLEQEVGVVMWSDLLSRRSLCLLCRQRQVIGMPEGKQATRLELLLMAKQNMVVTWFRLEAEDPVWGMGTGWDPVPSRVFSSRTEGSVNPWQWVFRQPGGDSFSAGRMEPGFCLIGFLWCFTGRQSSANFLAHSFLHMHIHLFSKC